VGGALLIAGEMGRARETWRQEGERENHELKWANEILGKVAAWIAQAGLDRRPE
jgi:hypothetical protein